MLFRQLEYFVAVANERHFARAAAACYVSQPALSAAIGKLERELGVSLINRGHSFEGLTPEGERLAVWARRILAEHDAFKAEVNAVQSGVSGQLRLGAVPNASTTASLTIDAFCSRHPLAKVHLVSRLSSDDIHRRIRQFELDAGITYRPDEKQDELEIVPLYTERYVLIAQEDLLTRIDRSVGWAEVAAQVPLALLNADMTGRRAIDDAFSKLGIRVTPQVETDSIAALFAHVQTGRWASIVPQNWFRMFLTQPNLISLPVTEPWASTDIVVAISVAKPGSVLARAFAAAAAALSLPGLLGGDSSA
jgi:DNA-binding transcriptional LysR family regulator